eukprot:gene1251-biopygen6891
MMGSDGQRRTGTDLLEAANQGKRNRWAGCGGQPDPAHLDLCPRASTTSPDGLRPAEPPRAVEPHHAAADAQRAGAVAHRRPARCVQLPLRRRRAAGEGAEERKGGGAGPTRPRRGRGHRAAIGPRTRGGRLRAVKEPKFKATSRRAGGESYKDSWGCSPRGPGNENRGQEWSVVDLAKGDGASESLLEQHGETLRIVYCQLRGSRQFRPYRLVDEDTQLLYPRRDTPRAMPCPNCAHPRAAMPRLSWMRPPAWLQPHPSTSCRTPAPASRRAGGRRGGSRAGCPRALEHRDEAAHSVRDGDRRRAGGQRGGEPPARAEGVELEPHVPPHAHRVDHRQLVEQLHREEEGGVEGGAAEADDDDRGALHEVQSAGVQSVRPRLHPLPRAVAQRPRAAEADQQRRRGVPPLRHVPRHLVVPLAPVDRRRRPAPPPDVASSGGGSGGGGSAA